MAKRTKVQAEPTIEELMKDIREGLDEMKFLCDQIDVEWDIASLTSLYEHALDVEDADEVVQGLKLARGIVADMLKLETTKPKLSDVLDVYFLTCEEE